LVNAASSARLYHSDLHKRESWGTHGVRGKEVVIEAPGSAVTSMPIPLPSTADAASPPSPSPMRVCRLLVSTPKLMPRPLTVPWVTVGAFYVPLLARGFRLCPRAGRLDGSHELVAKSLTGFDALFQSELKRNKDCRRSSFA
jgi:hypothetical protein